MSEIAFVRLFRTGVSLAGVLDNRGTGQCLLIP